MSRSKDTVFFETNVSGLCRCGCGEPTPISKRTVRQYALVKGKPTHYLTGHHRRLSPVRYIVEDCGYDTPCWVWQMSISPGGYGQIAVEGGKGKSIAAHRFYYEQKYGPIPEGLELDHLCRIRRCCNPDHVEPVTAAVNRQRGERTKLTRPQVEEIRSLYATGNFTLMQLGDHYGVTDVCIWHIVRFETWRDDHGPYPGK